jgi:hypothetical protein
VQGSSPPSAHRARGFLKPHDRFCSRETKSSQSSAHSGVITAAHANPDKRLILVQLGRALTMANLCGTFSSDMLELKTAEIKPD